MSEMVTADMSPEEANAIISAVPDERLKEAVELIRKAEGDEAQKAFVELTSAPEYADHLRQIASDFLTMYEFRPGDLVMWKPHLKDRQRPAMGTPAVVIEVLPEPIIVEANPVDGNYAERLTLRLGMMIRENRFAIYHFDSRRFMPYSPPGKSS